jgi:AcrR family transcriptional regulator
VATRAGISESVFYRAFSSAEKCYRAAFEEGLDRLSRTVLTATAREQAWLEGVRSGLVALLGFFDDEPSWARLLLVETPLSGTLTFECRQRLHELLAELLERGAGVTNGGRARRGGERSIAPETLTGALVVGGVFSVIHTSMLESDGRKLVELAPSLMAFIVAPRLGQAAAQAELEGKPCGKREALAAEPGLARTQAISRAAELPIRATHRTTMVLRAIAQAPYSNNREVADAAGLNDEGQASKLLARLERQGVIENVGIGAARGEPNAWLLTASGQRALALIGASAGPLPRGARIRGEA